MTLVLNVFDVPTAHRAFGGDVSDSLQQVPHLADPSHDEENLRSDALSKRGQGRRYSIWTNDPRRFSRLL